MKHPGTQSAGARHTPTVPHRAPGARGDHAVVALLGEHTSHSLAELPASGAYDTAPMKQPAWQLPSLHTKPVPQLVPSGFGTVAVQTGAPEPQAMTPVRQGELVGVQAAPVTQGTQVPLPLQTPPAQGVPASSGVEVA